jgi:bacillolysin
MSDTFHSIHMNVADEADEQVREVGARPLSSRAGPTRALEPSAFDDDEAAARYYLNNVFARDKRPGVRSLIAPHDPKVVPDLALRDTQRSPLTRTSIVRFVQTQASIPIFGSRAIVEIDRNRELLGIDAEVANVEGVSALTSLAAQDALQRIAAAADVPVEKLKDVPAPELMFFRDDNEKHWHLIYFFQRVPAAPKAYFEDLKSHGGRSSITRNHPSIDYLVDAHDGAILHYWSSTPTAVVKCQGIDEEGESRTFLGELTADGKFTLVDTLARIKTVDLNGGSIDDANPPTDAVCHTAANFQNFGGAISAHFNASLVCDFLKSVLKRDGVDGKGMELISYINCTSPKDENPPEWHNAVWWNHRMWYGQSRDAKGALRSFAQHLDIIAHELAHGITEFTADLVYFRQSGALNESFSDIFGVIIRNWDRSKPDIGGDVATWNWEIGARLGDNGLPLRDMRDPTRTGDPDHMDKYVETSGDNGGVHTNSNIHNKAAYNFLTANDQNDAIVFTPQEVAILYYLTLSRLDKLANFKQTLSTLLNVAGTYYMGDLRRQERLAAISKAYASVGIA